MNAATVRNAQQEGVDIFNQQALAGLIIEASSHFETDRCKAKRCIELAAELICGKRADDVSTPGVACIHGGLSAWQMRQVRAYIEDKLSERIRIGELAAHMRLSKGHFSRAFRVSFGSTPLAYIRERRMRRAEVLIRSSNEPLARIAVECGLCDQPHLSRVFRRLFGVTPNVWRRRLGPGPLAVTP